MSHRLFRRFTKLNRSRRDNFSRVIAFEPLEPRLPLTTFTVNSLTDGPVNLSDNIVTLRDAISAANTNVAVQPGGTAGSSLTSDVIQFQAGLTGTITLTQGQLNPRNLLVINGPGASLLTISGGATASRVFFVSDPAISSFGGVTIRGLTIRGGNATQGGGVLNAERLTIENVVITANKALEGAGIRNSTSGTLTVRNSQLSGNQAGGGTATPDGQGGGLYNAGTATFIDSSIFGNNVLTGTGGAFINSGTLTLQNSSVSGNSAARAVGGILNSGVLKVVNSTIANNHGFESGGFDGAVGALHNQSAGTVTLQSSTVSGNGATLFAGILNDGSMLLENSTVSGNIAGRDRGGISNSGNLTLRNSTIVGNRAGANNVGGAGAGIHSDNLFGVVMHNTIVAGNLRGPIAGPTTADNFSGNAASTASSHNLIGPGDSSGLANGGVNGNQIGVVNALLGPLASNGGATQTHLPLPGSPAINAGGNAQIPLDAFDLDGDSNTTEPIPFDQRGSGFARVNGGTVDVGAVEVQSDPTADFDFDNDVDGADFLIWQRGLGVAGVAATRSNGNADIDNDVDVADLAVWEAQVASAAAVDAASVVDATPTASASAIRRSAESAAVNGEPSPFAARTAARDAAFTAASVPFLDLELFFRHPPSKPRVPRLWR
jgi:hypothetical protein